MVPLGAAPAGYRVDGAGAWLQAAVANVRKVFIEMLRYLPNTLSLLVTFYAIFLFMMLGVRVVGDPAMAGENIRYLIVANAFWLLLLAGVSSMGGELTAEAMRGTLEQLYMSTKPTWFLLLARMVGTALVSLMLIVVMVCASMLTAGQWLNIDLPPLLLVLPPTLAGVIGLGFAVAGLALVYKQINAMLQIAQFLLMGLAFAPPSAVPGLVFAPAAKGIDMVRRVMVHGQGLGDFVAGDWGVLLLGGAVYFAAGLALFLLCERHAMRRGLLGQY